MEILTPLRTFLRNVTLSRSFPSDVNRFFHCRSKRDFFLLLWDHGDLRPPLKICAKDIFIRKTISKENNNETECEGEKIKESNN